MATSVGRRCLAATVMALGVCAGCGTLNYLDPSGPLHQGRFVPRTLRSARAITPLRVVSFNIAFAEKIDEALQVLTESPELQSPDILTLQEMDAPSTERMARELGLNWLYVPSAVHPKSDRDFGCAILSPWPLVEPGKVVLPYAALGSGVRRSAARATVLRGSQRLRVYSAHLPAPLGITDFARRRQVEVLLADAADADDPVVIAGDFNSHGLGELFVEAGFEWITRDVGATTKFFVFGLSYDHVYSRGLMPVHGSPSFGAVSDNRGASDHRPVWVLLVPPVPTAGEAHAP